MNPVLEIEAGMPKGAGPAQSVNPVPIEAMDLLPYAIEPKNSKNIMKSTCFEGVFGRLPKTEKLIFSAGLGHMAKVPNPFPKTV